LAFILLDVLEMPPGGAAPRDDAFQGIISYT